MKILLGRAAESIGDDIEPVYYFMDLEDRQVILRRCREKADATFTYEGKHYDILDNKYYGRIDHALNAYVLMRAGHSDTEGAVPAIRELLAALDKAMTACSLL